MAAPSGTDDSFASLFEQTASAHTRQRKYHVGESLEVVIVAIGREAVFADLGGKQEGLFERPSLSDGEGKLRIEVGARVTAVVDAVDAATGQVRLRPVVIRGEAGEVSVASAPSSQGAPGAVLVEGARVKGKVTGIERYGVFVQIAGTHGRNGRGLVPTQETGTSRGADLKKHFSVGQDVEAKILAVDPSGKIRLSIAALGADDERGLFEAFKSSQGTPGAAAPAAAAGAPAATRDDKRAVRNFGTLADLLPKGLAAATPKPLPKGAPQAATAASAPAATAAARGPASRRMAEPRPEPHARPTKR
jgi:small subunit ribosomal protein S1